MSAGLLVEKPGTRRRCCRSIRGIREGMTDLPDPSRFAHVMDWVFDLDNTLYPHHSNLFAQIDVKMTAYVAELLHLSREDARKVQKEMYLEYGTTLNGLMERHGV